MNIFSKELLNKKNTLPSGTVLFDSSTAGTSNVTIPMTMVYDVIMVGAGGGGDKGAIYTSYGGGGSGAAYVGKLKLTAGTVSITVGAGGKNGYYGGSSPTSGGSTYIGKNYVGGGGAGSGGGAGGSKGSGASVYGGYGKGAPATGGNGGSGYVKIYVA